MKKIIFVLLLCFSLVGCGRGGNTEISVEDGEKALEEAKETLEEINAIDGFLAAGENYEKYNSYAHENGLDGTLVYVEGNVLSQTVINSESELPTLSLVVEQEDGNRWSVTLPSKNKIDEIDGKCIRVFGTYQGFSDMANLPAVLAVDEESKSELQAKNAGGGYETVWSFEDYILEELADDKNETNISEGEEKHTDSEQKDALLYEDSNVKIYFSSVTENGVEFLVQNLTDLNLTIQAVSVSVNGISTDDISMSADVAPQSKGKVVARCHDFSPYEDVESVGGQLRIVDFSKTWDTQYYEATFVNVPIE